MKKAKLKTIEQNDNNTRTYQEDATLSGYVMDLQRFDELLKQAQRNGSITIEKNMIVDIENKTFEL